MHISQHFTKTSLLKLIDYLSNPIKTGYLEQKILSFCFTQLFSLGKGLSFSITYNKPCLRFLILCIKKNFKQLFLCYTSGNC